MSQTAAAPVKVTGANQPTEIVEWETYGDNFLAVTGPPQPPQPPMDRLKKVPSGTYTVGRSLQGYYLSPFSVINDKVLSLPNPNVDRVLNSIRKFWANRKRYETYELLYKRGILLHGAPGTGKSVTLDSLATELIRADGVVMYFSDPNTPVAFLPKFREREPDRPLIAIFEDLDLLLDNYGEVHLCKLLDGEFKIENIVYLATTNDIENISPRIRKRPSRFDEVLEITVGRETRETYLRHLLAVEKYTEEELALWTDKSEGLTLAHLKELLISVRVLDYPLDESVERLRGLSLTDEDE